MIKIIIVLLLALPHLHAQQCTSPSYERCICSTSTPYCSCAVITTTNSINSSLNYFSHLVLVSGQGCRPCPSSCLICSSVTICTTCQPSFQLINGTCIPCPINCQTCSNGICSLCNNGYYLDYYTLCQSCPISGTNICTINSLISCLSNYWLDNNAANCIPCGINCQQCSSTTKCSVCRAGYYLLSNFSCGLCANYCKTCVDSISCLNCVNSSLYYNSSNSQCQSSTISNCYIPLNSTACQQCDSTSYLTSTNQCVLIANSSLIVNCQQHAFYSNGTLYCRNCSTGYYNSSGFCSFGCSIMCNSCFGPHYGLCYGCVANSFFSNFHCVPTFNINSGSAFQLLYTAFNNPSFFVNGSMLLPTGCIPQLIYAQSSQLSFIINNPQSYMLTIKWKVYIYNTTSSATTSNYTVSFSNNKTTKNYNFTANISITCSSMAIVNKNGVTVQGVVLSNNLLTFSSINAKIGISQVLVIGYRCGGIQGSACLECSSTSTCTKCVNSNFYLSGYTCVQACSSSSFIRVATRSCQQICPSTTYTDYVHQFCLQCVLPCVTCVSNTSCLSCINSYYLYNKTCLLTCPSGYYPYDLTNTCEPCLRPCLTCLSNLKCLTCIYGFYLNTTYSCVFICQTGYYGDITTLKCQACISPCLTCNQYIGTQCQSCIAGYYFYDSKCMLACQDGFYSTPSSTQCLPCDSTCNTCQSSSRFCVSCRVGKYLLNNSCLIQCPAMHFSQAVSKSCQSCPQNCLSCLNLNQCQSCKNGSFFFVQNYSCLPTCPDYFYNNVGKCSNCQLPCVKCLSQTACLTCSGLFAYDYSCIANCPVSTYGDTATMKCQQCNTTLCLQCFISPSFCTRCQTNKILLANQCFDVCPTGYYYIIGNNTCSLCDVKCLSCASATFCLSCAAHYILQNGTCSKHCNSGYYLSFANSTTSCLPCSIGCNVCLHINSSLQCQSCFPNFFLINKQCTLHCPTQYYSGISECFRCPLPCLACKSQSQCTSCATGYGAFFNGSCLNECPLSYYVNTSTNICDHCSPFCLKCDLIAQNCTSCSTSLYLQLNTCVSTCSSGYYAPNNINICKNCNPLCMTCSLQPSNCTSCSSFHIFYRNLCLQFCPSGTYLSNKSCITCQVGCNSCINATYCSECAIPYFLNNNNKCVLNCSLEFFGYNGLCRKCSYPCQTCSNSVTCLSCSVGYFYNDNCIWTCPTSTYLNLSIQTCSNCPNNCSTCSNSSYCTECNKGVLVSGICQQNCPLGFFNYYSVCAPCMYGCLVCLSSNTCSQCYIGFLYQNICVEMCPNGWVEIAQNGNIYCQKCISKCLKCTSSPNQCISCASGLFLYIFSCLQDCPDGTYKDYSSSTCLSCTSPCETCKNGYSCLTCIYGYILYSQANGDQCIQGPTCPNSYYLNVQTNICVYNCPSHLYTQPNKGTCSKPCPSTYVLRSQNLTCLQYCPKNMWIDQSLICRDETSKPQILPNFTCKPLILRNLLIFDCLFSTEINNLGSLSPQNFSIPNIQISNLIIFNKKRVRLLTTMTQGGMRSDFITISLVYRYQLLSTSTASGRRLQTSGYLPVQNTNYTVFISEYFSYSKEQRRTGMQIMQISQSVCIGAFIFWLFALIKNLNSNSLTFILMLQWLHSLSLLDTTFSSNLGQFLQGFKYSNLFWFICVSSDRFLWKIDNSYREVLWGLSNYFEFTNAIFTPICIIVFFILIFLVSNLLYQKFREETQSKEGNIQTRLTQDSEKKQQQSIISNIPSQKDHQQQKKKSKGDNLSRSDIIKSRKSSKSHFSQCSQKKEIIKQVKILQKDQNQKLKEKQWNNTKLKIATKAKIIYYRYYYNYWLHCVLLTTSPISIASCCQIIASNPLSLAFSLLFYLFYIIIIVKFAIYARGEQKMYVSTKYWFIMLVQTLIFNGLAVLSTVQIYIGVSILILTINLYVWKRIFNSKKSNKQRIYHQINQLTRIIILVQGLIGYTNKKKWSSQTYYNYTWVFIGTIIILIILVAIQSTKQLIDQEQGTKTVVQTEALQEEKQNDSQASSKFTSRHYSSKEVSKSEDEQKVEEQEFFSEEEPVPESDSDIIDFDENTSINQQRAPKELIEYEKEQSYPQ